MCFSFFLIFVHSFNQSWCEPPPIPQKFIPDADLIQVQLITRHGARTPLHVFPNSKHTWQCNESESRSYRANENHPMHIQVKQGNSLFLGNCHYAQLIDRGATNLKNLGNQIRIRYINNLKFLPSSYNPNITKIRSSFTYRTIHSAMALADGLYPNHDSIDIETADKSTDPWRLKSSAICPTLEDNKEQIKNTEEWMKLDKQIKEAFQAAGDALNCTPKYSIDHGLTSRCNNYYIPPNATDEILDKPANIKVKMQNILFQNQLIYPYTFSFPAGEILNEMLNRINGKSRKKFIHWSVHDGNIFALLGYFGTNLTVLPPYGSYALIELYKSKIDNQFFCRFIYNGEDMKMSRFGGKSIVSLETLMNFVKTNMPDLDKDCHLDRKEFKEIFLFLSTPR